MRPVLIKTFGCKVNYAESTEFAARLAALGITARDYDHEAGLGAAVLINTCCVTAEAGRKALQFVRKLRREQPELAVAATGCGARLPEMSLRLAGAGATTFTTFAELTEWINQNVSRAAPLDPGAASCSVKVVSPAAPGRARAFIKVQDGCGCRCSYCIIPQVRPRTSRPASEVLELVQRAVAGGQRELVLTGVNLGAYGREQPVSAPDRNARAAPLIALVEQVLNSVPGGTRVRLSSLEPQDVDAPLLELFTHPQLCPHLHLPLQSGSEAVLRAMRRRYTAKDYLEIVHSFRRLIPHGAVSTDILVGYPTETDDDFSATLNLCQAAQFERVHGFPFSARPGTHAATLPHLPPGTASARNRELIAACAALADRAWQRFIGSTCPVLIEEQAGSGMLGHGPAYQIVRIPGGTPGELVETKLTDYANGEFHGQLV